MNLIKHYKRFQPQNKWLEESAFCPPFLFDSLLKEKEKKKVDMALQSCLILGNSGL